MIQENLFADLDALYHPSLSTILHGAIMHRPDQVAAMQLYVDHWPFIAETMTHEEQQSFRKWNII